ncbi:MAG: insulinase family protein [Clostridia bacterium]|nr:insulinase family protein [Clostridia bacterium]
MSFSPVPLNEGVKYTHIYTDRGKTDSLYVSFRIPLNERNLASITLVSKILLRGTKSFPNTLSICRECEDNYGAAIDIAFQKRGRELALVFMLSYMRNRFAFEGEDIAERAVKLLSEFIFAPYLKDGAFDRDYTEREKVALCAQIASLKNNKPAYAAYRAAQLMCAGEPAAVSIYNCADIVRGLTPAELTEFFENTVKNAPVDIIYAGNAGQDRILDLIKNHLPFMLRAEIKRSVIRRRTPDTVRAFTEEADASQSTLVMGFRLGGDLERKHYNDFLLFGAILSLSPVSKLFMNVREKLSLCYYCSGIPDRHNKVIYITAGIDAENSERVQKEILKQIDDIAHRRISENEYNNALSYCVSALISQSDDVSSLCSYYLSHVLRGVYSTLEEECEKLKKTSLDGAVEIAANAVLDTVYLLKGNVNANNQKEL